LRRHGKALYLGMVTLVFLACAWLLWALRDVLGAVCDIVSAVLTPFVISVVFAYMLNPLVCRLQKRGVPRGPSTFSGPVTVVFGNVDGGAPDFAMVLMNNATLTSSDFNHINTTTSTRTNMAKTIMIAGSHGRHCSSRWMFGAACACLTLPKFVGKLNPVPPK